jgi:hypothetical protein
MKPEDLISYSKNTPAVAYHKFVLLSRGRSTDLFCFFEGRDIQYYSPRIRQYVNKTYHGISCGNKDTVLNTFNFLNAIEEYKSYKKAFFVDSDFDSKINNPAIYETPCYSIENFYVNRQVLREILINEFGLTEADDSYSRSIEIFERELESFNESVLLFNAWYACLKDKKRKEALPSTNVSFDEKLPKDFIVLKIGEIKSQYDLTKIEQCFPDAIKVDLKDVESFEQDLRSKDTCMRLRGKYQMQFLYKFLQFLIDDANTQKKIIKTKTKFNIDYAQIFSQLTQYAITPVCLIQYLRQFN